MPGRLKRVTGFIVGVFAIVHLASAADREAAVADIRAKFAEDGKLTIDLTARRVPRRDPAWKPAADIDHWLNQQPMGVLHEAVDQAIQGGSMEERVIALRVYSNDVDMGDMTLNPAYRPILLDLLAKDDMKTVAYTDALVWTLKFNYPSRETLFTFMDAAKRAPTYSDREGLLHSAAYLCGIEWPGINDESRGPQVEKVLSDFESWFAQNKDRIQFTRKGKFSLKGPKGTVEQPGLSAEDRQRIRQDPACVLSLMGMMMGRDGEDMAKAGELNSTCGPALFGAEGSKAFGASLADATAGDNPSVENQINLSSLAGRYPVVDAGILAAVYVVGYDAEPANLEMAREALMQVNPADVRRVAEGEPEALVKKAQALANTDRKSGRD